MGSYEECLRRKNPIQPRISPTAAATIVAPTIVSSTEIRWPVKLASVKPTLIANTVNLSVCIASSGATTKPAATAPADNAPPSLMLVK